MKLFKSIISGILAIAIAISLTIPVFAVDPGTVVGAMEVAPDFGSWLWSGIKGGASFIGSFISDDICPGGVENPGLNARHDFIPQHTQVNGKTGMFYVCRNCQKAAGEVLEPAYDAYVQELPASSYNSMGRFVWHSYEGFPGNGFVYRATSALYWQTFSELPSTFTYQRISESLSLAGDKCLKFTSSFSGGKSYYLYCGFYFEVKAPISGSYILMETPCSVSNGVRVDGSLVHLSSDFSRGAAGHYFAGDSFFTPQICSYSDTTDVVSGVSYLYFPYYEIIPDDSLSADTYNTTTRPTSITGGNYGIVGDNGQITKVEDNSTIINETNNTYYNPATGQTQPITDWSYNYSDRSYTVTTETGDTVTVTYGDENITIQEGDTVYNVYYLIDGSGSETPVDPPAACEHDWQEASSTDPTCTLPGKVTLTCTKCQQTKTETIPALGHDWQVKQTVTTEYDDTGQLIQQGYTIFECSRCHEQYKSTDGTLPPGGGSGTDPGGEEGETIWDKLGNLLGTVGSGILGLIDAVLGKLLDGLISLAEMLMEKLKTVVETVLTIFDELPLLFSGFLSLLAALFPFLPPELMTILTFGVIAVVFIGIIKAVRR